MGIFKYVYNALSDFMHAHSKWAAILIVVALLVIILQLRAAISPQMIHLEGFTSQEKKYDLRDNDTLYDEFYTDIYDELFLQPFKLEYEVNHIVRATDLLDKHYKVLDVGSGRGHVVDQLQHRGAKVVGIDKSPSMVKAASELYPSSEYIHGDALNSIAFPEEEFGVITCLTFTVYYMKDKRTFFKNCMNWLKPGGYLILHLVDRNKFDPIVPAGKPLLIVSPQSVAKNRITNSLVKFNKFQYKADFRMPAVKGGDECKFDETITDDVSGKVRENIHTYYMPPRRVILDIAKECGFTISGHIDLTHCMNEYQYLYVLKKN